MPQVAASHLIDRQKNKKREAASMESAATMADSEKVRWLEGRQLEEVCCDLRRALGAQDDDEISHAAVVGLVLIHGTWNLRRGGYPKERSLLMEWIREATQGLACFPFAGCLEIDPDDDRTLECFIEGTSKQPKEGDTSSPHNKLPPPPMELPALALVIQNSDMECAELKYVTPHIRSCDLLRALRGYSHDSSSVGSSESNMYESVQRTLDDLESEMNLQVKPEACAEALRIFVAGDRSSVGKSSVCLGILGNLLAMGYPARSLAYIKPATQSESTQLIQLYCEKHGIRCVPIGPLVYYRGFTRAFLAGETDPTETLLEGCGQAVDRIARGRRVVLVDGVGFPAVGSICGTDNASVAKACSYPIPSRDSSETSSAPVGRSPMGVVLVGGSGVGAAVDAFNLNSTYFDKANVPVLGAIFNKLSETGFYSLENCKTQVTAYFDQNDYQRQHHRRPFGFVPLFSAIAGSQGMDYVDEYIRIFGSHVDVDGIVQAATRIKQGSLGEGVDSVKHHSFQIPVAKHRKIPDTSQRPIRSRVEIESLAIDAGAAPSA